MLMLVAATPYWIHISDAPTRQSVLALTGAGGEPASQEVAGEFLRQPPLLSDVTHLISEYPAHFSTQLSCGQYVVLSIRFSYAPSSLTGST